MTVPPPGSAIYPARPFMRTAKEEIEDALAAVDVRSCDLALEGAEKAIAFARARLRASLGKGYA